MRLNLGCGRDYRESWTNLDAWAERCDVRHDVRQVPWPFTDGQFSEIYASGILEQIGPNEQFRDVLNECHRVLEHGGQLTIVVPSARFPIAFRDPFDCRRFTEETWKYLTLGDFYFERYGIIYGFMGWKMTSLDTNSNGIMTAVLEKP